jgi:ubiquinol-cytochrome c reductase iron-sulfur subunit
VETQARAVEIFDEANQESGFGRRTLIRNTLIGALIAFPLPAVVLFRGFGPQNDDPAKLLTYTMWKKGTRLTRDPSGTPIKASDVTLGSVFHVIPEGLLEKSDMLEQKAKAAVLLMRLKPGDLHVSPDRKTWNYDGIVAYSKICTHVGCPVALYEQQTHHLLCPCHQSQFDITHEAKVIFGPAKRPLPQLPITVDSEGYLVARSDFTEPVGPSFWERH